MSVFSEFGLTMPRICLPDESVDPAKWAVVACDQYTAQPQWWDEAEHIVGDQPSTLKLIYPECRISQYPPDIAGMHDTMCNYLSCVLTRVVDGFILVERMTTCGDRLGLVVAIDLDRYDYEPGTKPLIRSTEGTVADRLPPRMDIRRGAPLELPHVMLLVNDEKRMLIEPLFALRDALSPVYDCELMLGGGHLRGWAIDQPAHFSMMEDALSALAQSADGFLFAVGDGNHSLAAARGCWLEIKKTLSTEAANNHPARFALVELTNLYDPALVFEPIHRAVFGADGAKLCADFSAYCAQNGMTLTECESDKADLFIDGVPLYIEHPVNPLAVAIVQPFLDAWLAGHPEAEIDYIHGLDALNQLNACRIALTAMDKRDLFPSVREGGALPRKTFSMGEACDKRYYFESRALEP